MPQELVVRKVSDTHVGETSSGFALVVAGFVPDLVASNRRHPERLDWELQRLRDE